MCGSEWRHPSLPDEHKPDDATLFDILSQRVPDESTRNRILVWNPEALLDDVDELQWHGPNRNFSTLGARLDAAVTAGIRQRKGSKAAHPGSPASVP